MAKPLRNPYLDDEDDVDDLTFLSHSKQGPSGYVLGNGNQSQANNDYQQRKQQLLEERRKIEERTLQSSKVSLGLVYESEQMGISTAEELMRQREKLNNVDTNLDNINSTMRVTQKHLNTMKSWFGGMFSKNTDGTTIPASKSTNSISRGQGSSSLGETIDKISNESARRSSANHPALAHRGIEPSGFTFDDEDDFSKSSAVGGSSHANRSRDIDKQLNANLGELGLGLNRLKGLALGLGEEIEQQNEVIDRITTKAERAEDTVQYQNRQMRNLLKK